MDAISAEFIDESNKIFKHRMDKEAGWAAMEIGEYDSSSSQCDVLLIWN